MRVPVSRDMSLRRPGSVMDVFDRNRRKRIRCKVTFTGGGRMTTRVWSFLGVLLVTASLAAAAQQTPSAPAPGGAAPPSPRVPPPAGGSSATGPRASAVTVTVTNDAGSPVQGVNVTVTGPVTRTVTTVANGTARRLGMRSGTYRLRF